MLQNDHESPAGIPRAQFSLALLVLCCLGFTASCGEPVATLRACNSPADCADGMQCIEGLCRVHAIPDDAGVVLGDALVGDVQVPDGVAADTGGVGADAILADRQTLRDVIWPDRVGVDVEAFSAWPSGEICAGAGILSGSRYHMRGKLNTGLHQGVLQGQRYQLRLHAQRLSN